MSARVRPKASKTGPTINPGDAGPASQASPANPAGEVTSTGPIINPGDAAPASQASPADPAGEVTSTGPIINPGDAVPASQASPADPAAEVTSVHTRLLKCALEVDESQAYWRRVSLDDAGEPIPRARRAFAEYWFGARSMARVAVLITNFRARFDRYPQALHALRRWTDMAPDTRALVCHWHLQLSDPMYRAFTGEYLAERHGSLRASVRRDIVVGWVAEQGPGRWTMATRIQLASKLLSAAYSAGLLGSNRDPRPLCYPRIEDDALTYLFYLLRATRFAGTLLENPYLASVGLGGGQLDQRLRGLGALGFRRMGDLVDVGWCYPSLAAWADSRFAEPPSATASSASTPATPGPHP